MARRGDGLYLRAKTWYLDCRIDGRRHVVKLGKGISRTVAKELASVQRGAILKAEAGIGKKRKDVSFEKAKLAFTEWVRVNKRPRTACAYQKQLTRLTESFSGKTLGRISSFDVERHKRTRADAGARIQANRELAVLKTLFNRAKAWGLYEGENPVLGVRMLEEPKRRLRYLEAKEESTLLEVAPEPLRSLIVIGVNTGLRIAAEALPLKWEDVDLSRGILTVQAAYAKNGQTRNIPLNTRAHQTLEQLKQTKETKKTKKSEYVFAQPNGKPYQSMGRWFRTACKEAGLVGVTLHTLRHTFASRLVMTGADLRTIQELGGWSDLSLVQRYSHLAPSHKASAIEAIAKSFHNTIHNSPILRSVDQTAEQALNI